jgi:hypothetical protein
MQTRADHYLGVKSYSITMAITLHWELHGTIDAILLAIFLRIDINANFWLSWNKIKVELVSKTKILGRMEQSRPCLTETFN